MPLRFIGIDPETDGDNCPAVFIDEDNGDLLFQGSSVTDPRTPADEAQHSPIADYESLVMPPARMREIIMEKPHRQGAAVQRTDRGDDDLSGSSGDPRRLHA